MTKKKWIWYDYGHDCLNAWMQARRTFTLKRVPGKVCARVTADAKYKLFVNGQTVCRGPARGFQSSWPVDTVDIAPFLRKGKNVIAALVHTPGVSTFQYIHQGQAGLLFDCAAGREDLSSGPLWKVRKAPGYLKTLTRLSLQLGFQEHYDAREEDAAWTLPSYGDRAWCRPCCRNAGAMPWASFEERGIPMLREKPASFASVFGVAGGVCARGFASAPDVVDLYNRERKKWIRPETIKAPSFKAKKSGVDRFVAYCLDFGRETAGSVRLDISGAAGGEIVDVLATESVTGLSPDFAPVTEDCYVAMGGRVVLRKGRTLHEFFDYWGFRYLVLIVRNSSRPLAITAGLNTVAYPLNVIGAFSSSDKILNDVHAISVRTQKLCMFDAYVDCPWREQAQWWGDARVQARNTFFLSADARLFRRGIRQIGTQQLVNGLTYGHAPTYGHNCILPDFTLTWIATHFDYYWQTGDLSLFREMKDRVIRALEYFRKKTDANGLVGYDDRYWLFLDWCDIFKEGYPTLYNLYYIMALEAASKLFTLIGEKTFALELTRRESSLRKAVLHNLYDREKKRFFGGLTWRGKPVPQERAHTYALSVLLDLVPQENGNFARRRLAHVAGGSRDAENIPSPFFMYYLFEALKKTGEKRAVIDCIRRWWGTWVRQGLTTTPEIWPEKKGRSSLCHAWSAHPIIHLPEILLGVRQTSPAWKTIEVAPCLCGVESVRGSVATPLGLVKVFLEQQGKNAFFSLLLPAGMEASVRLPGQAPKNVTGSLTSLFPVKA